MRDKLASSIKVLWPFISTSTTIHRVFYQLSLSREHNLSQVTIMFLFESYSVNVLEYEMLVTMSHFTFIYCFKNKSLTDVALI